MAYEDWDNDGPGTRHAKSYIQAHDGGEYVQLIATMEVDGATAAVVPVALPDEQVKALIVELQNLVDSRPEELR